MEEEERGEGAGREEEGGKEAFNNDSNGIIKEV